MTERFAIDPALPPVYVGLVVLVLVALAARAGVTKHLVLRTISLALVGVVLLGPVALTPTATEQGKPVIVLLADSSLSMGTRDVSVMGHPSSRSAALSQTYLEPNYMRMLRDISDVRPRTFDEALRAFDEQSMRFEPAGQSTDLHGNLERAIAPLPEGSAIVLMSDGRSTSADRSVSRLAGLAKVSGVRVHTLCVGTETSASDVRLRASPARDLVFDGMPIELDVSITQSGYEGRRATVRAMDAAGTRTLASRELVLSERSDFSLRIPPENITSSTAVGEVREILVRVDPLPGEADPENNERRVFVRVTGQRIRVLLLEGAPSWEARFLARALARDPQVELTTVTGLGHDRLRTGGADTRTPRRLVRLPNSGRSPDARSAPDELVDERLLSGADIVIFGERVDAVLTPELSEFFATRIADVGGAAIFLRVPPAPLDSPVASALQTIAGVRWTDEIQSGGGIFPAPGSESIPPVRSIIDGSADRVLTDLPGMRAVTRTEGAKSLTTLWLTDRANDGTPRASLAHLRVGRGQTLSLMSEGLWRWALLPETDGNLDSVYRDFWARTVRWLALGGDFLPGQAVSVRADRVIVNPGQPVRVSVRARDTDSFTTVLGLTHTSPDGVTGDVPLAGVTTDALAMRATVTPELEGVHELTLRTATDEPHVLRFAVYDDREELRDTSADPALMREIAGATGGEVLTLEGRNRLLEIIELETRVRQSDTHLTRTIAWDSPWLFAAIVTLLLIEWVWRRAGS